MQPKYIATTRLHSQQIAQTAYSNPVELVKWMGALQAQDFAMVQWALGLRLKDSTHHSINDAIDSGEIIRTHAMRPTWHLIAADDIYWMLELTAPQIKSSSKSRHKWLGLTEKLIAISHSVITNTIMRNGNSTREEIANELSKAGFEKTDNRHAHLLMLAELDGLICSGQAIGKKQTFALLEERVPNKIILSKEEALATLAGRYFASHCPATLQDFVWWSGLYVKDARKAIESISKDLIDFTLDSETYYVHHSFKEMPVAEKDLQLLPAFDEYIISYKDRSASITSENHSKAVSNNGIFWPIIILNGQVIGTWKRAVQKENVNIEISFFTDQPAYVKKAAESKAKSFGAFLGKKPVITFLNK